MNIGAAVYAVLQGIGNGCFPGRVPESVVAPYMLYMHFGAPLSDLGGKTDQQMQRVQIDCYAATHAAAETMAAQAEAALDAYTSGSGLLGSPPSIGVTQEGHSYFGVDPDVNLHRVMLDYSVWYVP